MSRKDYQTMAALIRDEWDALGIVEQDGGIAHAAVYRLAQGIAEMFRADNPNFSYQRFYDACGIPLPQKFAGKK